MTKKELRCAECGGVVGSYAEYHPYAFCVLVKAGLDPWQVVREAAQRLRETGGMA